MKAINLSVFLALFLTSCGLTDPEPVKPEEVKLKAGQKVRTKVEFYSNCEGAIYDYEKYKRYFDPVTYEVIFTCPNVGQVKHAWIPETSLIAVPEKVIIEQKGESNGSSTKSN